MRILYNTLFSHFQATRKFSTNRQIDKPTDRQTDRLICKPTYRSSYPGLKKYKPVPEFKIRWANLANVSSVNSYSRITQVVPNYEAASSLFYPTKVHDSLFSISSGVPHGYQIFCTVQFVWICLRSKRDWLTGLLVDLYL